jgi:hypothetical protein
MKRMLLMFATGVAAWGLVSVAAAASQPFDTSVRACITAGGFIRVRATCGSRDRAVRLTLTPLSSTATFTRDAHPGSASRLIQPRSINGAVIKPKSIPAGDLILPIRVRDIGSGIDGRHIARGTLPFSSLSASLKSALASLIGKQIPTGPRGNTGPPGPVGPPVQLATSNFAPFSIPSDFSGFAPDENNLTAGPSRIVTVDAPASTDGHYLVSAVANVFSNSSGSGEFVGCQLTVEPTPVAFGYFARSFVGPLVAPTDETNDGQPQLSNGLATLSMQWAHSFVPGTPVSLDCEDFAGADAGIGSANLSVTPTN